MSTPNRWTRRLHLVGVGAVLLSGMGLESVSARQASTLGVRMATMSGTGLTGAECQQRMQHLNLLLQGAGYRTVRTQTLEDGTLVARWYNTARKTTVLAFAGQNRAGNAFSAMEHRGLLRWNEVIGAP